MGQKRRFSFVNCRSGMTLAELSLAGAIFAIVSLFFVQCTSSRAKFEVGARAKRHSTKIVANIHDRITQVFKAKAASNEPGKKTYHLGGCKILPNDSPCLRVETQDASKAQRTSVHEFSSKCVSKLTLNADFLEDKPTDWLDPCGLTCSDAEVRVLTFASKGYRTSFKKMTPNKNSIREARMVGASLCFEKLGKLRPTLAVKSGFAYATFDSIVSQKKTTAVDLNTDSSQVQKLR